MSVEQLPDSFDVLVVGGGAAGLYAALCIPNHLTVGLITKDTLSLSASDWAQGGIAAAVSPDDSPRLHLQDTLKAGAGLCEPEAVQLLVSEAAHCINALVDMGVGFDRKGSDLALTLEAAHSRRRVLHAADTTGRAVVTTLTEQVLQRSNIHVFSQAFVLDLWLHPETSACLGVCLMYEGQLFWLRAGATVLATGGGGQVYAQTTNPSSSTGDGVAIAWRAGALLRDLEFVQFHPTALTQPGAPRFLISEAVRGEGAHLIDAQGHRFAFDYDPNGELAPRDVVSRAIFSHLQATSVDPSTAHVWLDLRPIPPEVIHHRFPNIVQVCQQWGIDVMHQPIPVAPAAHYWMGGIWTDSKSRTTISGLYAVGETASTGVHGANRLASNSLLECLVYGAQLAQVERLPLAEAIAPVAVSLSVERSPLHVLEEWRRDLPRLVWQCAGISREQSYLETGIHKVSRWREEFAALPLTQVLISLRPGEQLSTTDPESPPEALIRLWAEVRNLLDVAYLILKSAAFRTESRGGHYRNDFPKTDPSWRVHTLVQGDRWYQSQPVPDWEERG